MASPYRTNEVCPACGSVFANKGLLALHMRSPARGYRAAHHISIGLANNGKKRRQRAEASHED